MRLGDILAGLEVIESRNAGRDIEITGIAYDSRKVRKGTLFVCIEGFTTDGHLFAMQAVRQGAAAVLAAKATDTGDCPWILVPDTRLALALASRMFFGDPSARLPLVGVTGTAGKTSISFLYRTIMETAGKRTGLIGPVANIIGGEESFAVRSTPESSDLLALMDEMAAAGAKSAVMEVSSQGIGLGRIDGCTFFAGVFANLYSDFVGISDPPAFREALDSKIRFAGKCGAILVNHDAEHAKSFISMLGKPVVTFGLDAAADVHASMVRPETRQGRVGTSFLLDSPWYAGELFIGIPCGYHVSNALAAIACAALQGVSLDDVRRALAAASVPGCVEPVPGSPDGWVYVDSAHTPATLERLLDAMKRYVPGRLTCVFGCSGRSTTAVRNAMGRVASRLADRLVIVPDNPYLESPAQIAAQIAAGFEGSPDAIDICDDRARGIALAIDRMISGDVVLITGKGHQHYQMFGNRTEAFSDVEQASSALAARMGKGDR